MIRRLFFPILFALAVCSNCQPSLQPAGQRTDALAPETWETSQWISVADAPVVEGPIHAKTNNRAADGASWFVASPVNGKKVRSAVWMTSGLGVYELYVNGRRVGEDALKPGFTHYAKTKYAFTYDITAALECRASAENHLCAQVTPGWWGDKIVTPDSHEGMIGKKCAFRSVLELTYTDGSKECFPTDTLHWKAGIAGPVLHAAIFDGEEFDARILPGFLTPEKLGTPEVNREFAGEVLPTAGAEICYRPDLALKPQRAYVWKEVEGATEEEYGTVSILREYPGGKNIHLGEGETLVVDFGQNASAVPAFEFKAEEGTVLTCLPGELLNDGNGAKSRGMDGPEGTVHRTNLRIPDSGMRLVYTFGPSKIFVRYQPRCTFFGYRFVSITATGDVDIRSLSSIPVTSITKTLETGTMATGDPLVNRLISNTVWGQRSNYLSVPTDCPQRNERLGWTADTQVFAETGSFFADTKAFFHKWMRDMRDSQSESGSFPGVAPTAQYGGNMMRVGWADAGIIVPWTVWKQFDDKQIIEENWAAMDKYFHWVSETKFAMAAIREECDNYQWADWLSYEPLESAGKGAFAKDARDEKGRRLPLPEAITYWDYLGACYWMMDAGMMRQMAEVTGRDATFYAADEVTAKAYLIDKFLQDDGSFILPILNTMQTPALFALKLGLVEGDAREAMIARLKENFAAHDNCLQTGFLGTSILMETLSENGMDDIAYELLFQRKNPSWLYSVDNGATTIWERWNSYTLEYGMGPKGMNSFNHYAYGCVCAWLWKVAAGIAADPEVPGFRHILMRPVPDRRLGHLDAAYHSAAGLIKSTWHYEGDRWIWGITIPEGATASVLIPGEEEAKEVEYGTYVFSVKL